jgi:hypothetical protein
VIGQIKADLTIADLPVMLVANYPEHQEAAMAVGAVRSFGKLEFEQSETRQRLADALQNGNGPL